MRSIDIIPKLMTQEVYKRAPDKEWVERHLKTYDRFTLRHLESIDLNESTYHTAIFVFPSVKALHLEFNRDDAKQTITKRHMLVDMMSYPGLSSFDNFLCYRIPTSFEKRRHPSFSLSKITAELEDENGEIVICLEKVFFWGEGHQ